MVFIDLRLSVISTKLRFEHDLDKLKHLELKFSPSQCIYFILFKIY